MSRWLHVVVPALVLLAGLAVRAIDPAPVALVRLKVFDVLQQIAPRSYQPAPVRIVDLDDASLRRLGQWPWPRILVARMVENLRQAGAAAIALDIVFAEPDRTSPREAARGWADAEGLGDLRARIAALPDHDMALAKALEGAGAVTGFMLTGGDDGGPLPDTKAGIAFAGDNPTFFVPGYRGSVVNLPNISAAGAGNGSVNVVPDGDGIVRRLPLLVQYQGKLFPNLTVEALRVAQGANTYVVKSSGASGEQAFGERTGVVAVKVGGAVIPTDSAGRVWLYQTPEVPARTLPAWRIHDGAFDPALIGGHIVFIGTSAAGLGDLWTTPLRPAVPGVEVHAQIVEQVLSGTFLERPEWADGAELLYLLVLGGALIALFAWVGAGWSAPLAIAAIAGAFGASWYGFTAHGMLFAPLYPAFIVLLVYLSSSLIGYLRTESEKRFVRTAFSRYLAPPLVEKLSRDPGSLKLGGESREVTIMFLDVRGFTTISEKLRPEELTGFVNRFLTPMTEAILSHNGTVGSYTGDGAMAFWNAPIDDSDHARNACAAALGMLDNLDGLNATLAEEGEEAASRGEEGPPGPIRVGVGINTGHCVAGNVGSDQRFDYSIIGDDVNLSARLEGQSKTYRVPIILSESTASQAPDFAMLELDLIQVKGRYQAVRIFGLIGDKTVLDSAEFAALKAAHDAMIEAYRRQDWAVARHKIAECRRLNPAQPGISADPFYDAYEERITGYEIDPPPADWGGVFVAESK